MENILKGSRPKMTGQNDRQYESLTGQVHDQARHCPLTGRYFEPCHLHKLLFPENTQNQITLNVVYFNRRRVTNNMQIQSEILYPSLVTH